MVTVDAADLIILASPDRDLPIDLDRLELAMRSPAVARDLARVGVGSLPDLLRYYRGRLDRLASCSIRGCSNASSRRCDGCGRLLCQECWCEHEVELAKSELRKRHASSKTIER